ncbi:MAG: D-amino-acid transaminase [Deltaproteobacteria bacterium]|nr:D-amino-acid transaminase [Deltaproteobacteria bacterium]
MKDQIVFFNGDYLEKEAVKISPEDRGFLFGDGVYEVIKTYQGKMFEFDAHLSRLERSLNGLEIQFEELDNLKSICHRLSCENKLDNQDAAIYIEITRGAARRTHCFPGKPVAPAIYMMINPCPSTKKEQGKGVKIIFRPDIRWARCDIKSVALVANVLATQKAVENDAAETVFIRDGAVTEGASSNFFAVFDDVLYTHPESHYILSGITRKVVLELCYEIGVRVKQYPILSSRLDTADEMMVVSTTKEIIPVIQYDDKKVGDGTPGPVARELQQAFDRATAKL